MKVLACSRENNIRTRISLRGDKIIEQLNNFKYLGSNISSGGRCKK